MKFFHLQLSSFFFFKNKSGLKEATKRLCFLLVERRHGFNSLTSSPHTTAQTCEVQDVPGFPFLNPLASPCGRLRLPHLRAPQAPFRPRPAGRGTAKGWSPRGRGGEEDWPAPLAEEPSLLPEAASPTLRASQTSNPGFLPAVSGIRGTVPMPGSLLKRFRSLLHH